MILLQGSFNINVDYKNRGKAIGLLIKPNNDHFCVIAEGNLISRLKNPDLGVWEQIEGQLSSSEIDSIAHAIHNRYIIV
jgi:hypothetical protein